jgi:hypothetical protein
MRRPDIQDLTTEVRQMEIIRAVESSLESCLGHTGRIIASIIGSELMAANCSCGARENPARASAQALKPNGAYETLGLSGIRFDTVRI